MEALNSTQTIPHSAVPGKHHDIRTLPETERRPSGSSTQGNSLGDNDDLNNEPSIWACALAGGLGGVIGDTTMHSLDTVKTRQQGASHNGKYDNTLRAYRTIFKEEGLRRGLYGGYGAAALGSIPSSAVFFLSYETVKREALAYGIPETISYLTAGFIGDLVSSVFYVPSEVLKTRLQLQGRYNNPYCNSGYNYKGLIDAASTIVRTEGINALFYGYRATLTRDLPFSALQFTFYEKFRQLASRKDGTLSLLSELLTGAAAGGLAGMITTPLDVVKTRMQTQNATSSIQLNTHSVFASLRTIHACDGIRGLFSGIAPRFIWTSVQSSVMLLLYQVFLKTLSKTD